MFIALCTVLVACFVPYQFSRGSSSVLHIFIVCYIQLTPFLMHAYQWTFACNTQTLPPPPPPPPQSHPKHKTSGSTLQCNPFSTKPVVPLYSVTPSAQSQWFHFTVASGSTFHLQCNPFSTKCLQSLALLLPSKTEVPFFFFSSF